MATAAEVEEAWVAAAMATVVKGEGA